MTDIHQLEGINTKRLTEVLKKLKKCGVTKIKLGTLEIELNKKDEQITTRALRPALKVSKREIENQEKRQDAQIQLDDSKEELSTLHVENPLAFEQALVDQQIEDARGDDEEAYGI